MKAHVIKPFEKEQIDNTTVNLWIALGVLHEEFGFGEERCMRFVNAFTASRDEYNRLAKKEGKFTADCYLKRDMNEIFNGKVKKLYD